MSGGEFQEVFEQGYQAGYENGIVLGLAVGIAITSVTALGLVWWRWLN